MDDGECGGWIWGSWRLLALQWLVVAMYMVVEFVLFGIAMVSDGWFIFAFSNV